jgi:trigger factor
LPEKLSSQQAARNLEQYRLELLYRGATPEEVEEQLAETRSDTDAQTRNRLKRFFLLHRLGEQYNIEVSEQEVNGRIAAIAAQRNVRPEKLRTELSQAGRLGEVARLIRDQKAADKLVAQVKQVEVSADEWNEIFKKKQKDAAAARSKPAKTPARKPAAKKADDEAAPPKKAKAEAASEKTAKAPAPKKKSASSKKK